MSRVSNVLALSSRDFNSRGSDEDTTKKYSYYLPLTGNPGNQELDILF